MHSTTRTPAEPYWTGTEQTKNTQFLRGGMKMSTLVNLDTPYERRRVIEYGAGSNKVVHHWYEAQHIAGPLYKGTVHFFIKSGKRRRSMARSNVTSLSFSLRAEMACYT